MKFEVRRSTFRTATIGRTTDTTGSRTEVRVDTVLLKVASRCNLDCSYCYVYHMGDEGWRSQPKRLSSEIRDALARELGSLMREQGRPFSVVLHGGEPLLLGGAGLDTLLGSLRGELGTTCGI